jgi:hypothetical protein
MGLLDDAIREHLELKRLRGADPRLVARDEHEALGPVRSDESESANDDGGDPGDLAAEVAPLAKDEPAPRSRPDQAQSFSNVGQETAELDMRTVLDGEPGHHIVPPGPTAFRPVEGQPSTVNTHPEQGVADDSLEWETPGDGASKEPVESDRHTGGENPQDDVASDQPDEPVEDVLEEIPDFLRDTPEQERLWFEQRPPRDFDFDK